MNNALSKAAGNAPANRKQQQPTTIQGMLKAYKGELERALPKHMTADRLARVALTECRKTPKLLQCKPESLFGAVIQCAQLGLEPGGALGHAYLIPFGQEVQFIVGYRGMIDLARRSGQIESLNAVAVYEGDKFECKLGLNPDIQHEPDWDNPDRENPEKLKFVYAVAKLKDGGTQFEVMSRKGVDMIRTRSKSGNNGPWKSDYVAMALKTVIRRLFKYLPVSIEMQKASNIDENLDAGVATDNWTDVIDGDYSEKGDVTFKTEAIEQSGPTYAQIMGNINKAKTTDDVDVELAQAGHLPKDQFNELVTAGDKKKATFK